MVPCLSAKVPCTVWRVAATVNSIREFAGSSSRIISCARSVSALTPRTEISAATNNHRGITRRGLKPFMPDSGPSTRSSTRSAGEMIVDVLFGGNGHAVLGCGSEAPVLQRRKHLLVDSRPEALNHDLLHNNARLVDRDFDDNISFDAGCVRSKCRIRRHDRQRWSNFRAGEGSVRERSVERSSSGPSRPGGGNLITRFSFGRRWLQTVRACNLRRSPQGKRLRLLLRNSGVASEINAS